jgi:iron-sulfur cluster repair protein YtfE (RIC family)
MLERAKERCLDVDADDEACSHICCEWSGATNIPRMPVPSVILRLQKQHEKILHQNRALLRCAKRNTRIGASISTHLTRLEKLVTEHQKQEERILIPIVDKYLDSHASKSIRRDNREMLETLRRVKRKLLQLAVSDQRKLSSVFIEPIAEFDSVVHKQFSREENVIYWFASLYLSHKKNLMEL